MRRPELLRIALAVGITLAVMGLAVMFFMLVFDQDPVGLVSSLAEEGETKALSIGNLTG
jgi:hypothetical protein